MLELPLAVCLLSLVMVVSAMLDRAEPFVLAGGAITLSVVTAFLIEVFC